MQALSIFNNIKRIFPKIVANSGGHDGFNVAKVRLQHIQLSSNCAAVDPRDCFLTLVCIVRDTRVVMVVLHLSASHLSENHLS